MPPPYIAQVSLVGMELQNALGVFYQAQAVLTAQGSVPLANALDVLHAVESLPSLIPPGDAAKIRELLQAGDAQGAFQRLNVYQNVLQTAQDECAAVPAAANLTLERIANVFGLEAEEFRAPPAYMPDLRSYAPSKAAPLAPREAEQVTLRFAGGQVQTYRLVKDENHAGHCLTIGLGSDRAMGVVLPDRSVSDEHAEITFRNGRYWLQDKGTANGCHHQGWRLSSHDRVPLRDGERITIGRYTMVVQLPYEKRLTELSDYLKDIPTYRAVFAVLEREGFGELAARIKEVLLLPYPVKERLRRLREIAPHDGGLRIKLEALLLRGEAVRLRSLYFPKKTIDEALSTAERLVKSLESATGIRDLAERLRRTNAEGFKEEIARLESFEDAQTGANRSLEDFPEVFGLRDQVRRIFLEKLSLTDDQKQDLRSRRVTPDLLAERPWRGIQISQPLEAALGRFRRAIGKRLNLDTMEETIRTSFGDEQDVPSQKPSAPDSDSGLGLATQMVLYKEYQAKSPTSSLGTGTLTESQTESKKPEFFRGIWDRLYADGIFAQPDGYWFFGGTIGAEERFEGRIYLSLRRRHAEAIFRYLNQEIEPAINAEGGRIQYKIAGNPEGYSRADSGVIYFYARDQKAIHRAVAEMARAHPEFFKPGHPLFTMPLKDESGRDLKGLSFGEHPKNSGVSFGSLRTDAMTTAVRTARALMNSSEPPDWSEIRQICAYFLKRAGVDIENPSFNDGGREKFGPLLEICEWQPAVVPQLAAVAAKAPQSESFQDLIGFEIRERYPVLAAGHMREWTARMAADIFKAWEKSDRRAGSGPNAPTMVPEEIFDARMSLLFAHVAKDASQSDLLKQIMDNDQGPRLVRAVAARAKADFPSLKGPGMETVVRTLADNVHRAWKSQSPKAGETLALFEGIYRGRLKWMRGHLEAQEATLSEGRRSLLAELNAYFLVT